MLYAALKKRTSSKICAFCPVPLKSVLCNLLCFLIFFQNAGSQLCFRLFFFFRITLFPHWWDFSGYSQISGFRFLSESNKNSVEMPLSVIFPLSGFKLFPCPTHILAWFQLQMHIRSNFAAVCVTYWQWTHNVGLKATNRSEEKMLDRQQQRMDILHVPELLTMTSCSKRL